MINDVQIFGGGDLYFQFDADVVWDGTAVPGFSFVDAMGLHGGGVVTDFFGPNAVQVTFPVDATGALDGLCDRLGPGLVGADGRLIGPSFF